MLNYRIIGFSGEQTNDATRYNLEIADGCYNSADSFARHITVKLSDTKNKIIAKVPSFGRSYTWRMVANTGKEKKSAKLYHFSTGMMPDLDSNNVRFRIITPASKYKNAFFFLDGNKALYDMAGQPVWYMPEVPQKRKVNMQMVDVKITSVGTITFILNNQAYEVDYNGKILWQAPDDGSVSGDTTEHYHHQLTRLSNGHYMVLGTTSVLWKRDPTNPSKDIIAAIDPRHKTNDTAMINALFGTLIEYDKKGNVVWAWTSQKYFTRSDVRYLTGEPGRRILDIHENAFFFDEKTSNIYISCKNISRIIKLKYPDGTITAAYGEVFKPGTAPAGNGLFCNQHACNISDEGYLYLFNNNNCGGDSLLPTVVLMQEPAAGEKNLKKIWEYTCTEDGITEATLRKQKIKEMQMASMVKHPGLQKNMLLMQHPTSGGNVKELPDHSFFVSMDNEHGKIFIVNKNKEELWSGVAEKWNIAERKWMIMLQYRASITDSTQLEKLIWNSGS